MSDSGEVTLDSVKERTGGRSARVRQSVLDAVREEVLEGGYGAVTHANVARRAGVDRATVYRRWPNKARLAMDALVDLAEDTVTFPDSGPVRKDLQKMAGSVATMLETPALARLFQALIAAQADDPGVRDIAAGFWQDRLALGSQIITAAVDRGEIEPVEDPKQVMEALIAPFYFRTLISCQDIDRAFISDSVDRAVGMLTFVD
jgi:AcrR family transcriptional regulator